MAAWPSPVFEGSEKRLEIDFAIDRATVPLGLRSLDRLQLDALMVQAACCIVSARSNGHFDAYVLSESSLFIYDSKFVLKTCGTTQLLRAVPLLLTLAADIGCEPVRCKYSRASFLFPQYQPEPYQSFKEEAAQLDAHFNVLGSAAYVLGDADDGLQWHVYVAGATPAGARPTCSLEVCMTELDAAKAAQFYRDGSCISAAHTTAASGIRSLLPGAVIDDYVFEPCGYSMNSQERGEAGTIHITPEAGFSYASFELSGFEPGCLNAAALVAKVAEVFNPGKMTVTRTCDLDLGSDAFSCSLPAPSGYACSGISGQAFAAGGGTVYCTYDQSACCCAEPGSPSTVLDRLSSCSDSGASSDTEAPDSELYGTQ